jgi:hypothetical protein
VTSDEGHRPTEFPAADRSDAFTMPAIQAAPISSVPETRNAAEQRIDRLLAEILDLMNERKMLREVADHRSERCSELLEHVRFARIRLRAFFAKFALASDGRSLDSEAAKEIPFELAELLAWVEKPI